MVFRSLSLHEKVVPVQILHLPVHPPPVPSSPLPSFPLIVMVMDSIVRDHNGQLNWWKRDHQEGREEGGLHISGMKDFHSLMAEGIHYGTWRHSKKTVGGSAALVLCASRLLGMTQHPAHSCLLSQEPAHFNMHECSSVSVESEEALSECGHTLIMHISFLLHLPVRGMCSHTMSRIIKGDFTVVSPSSLSLGVMHIFSCESFINL